MAIVARAYLRMGMIAEAVENQRQLVAILQRSCDG
jgi:hypothetical protein